MHSKEKYEYPSSEHRHTGYPVRAWAFSFLMTPLVIVLWELFERDDTFDFSIFAIFFYVVWLLCLLPFVLPAAIVYMILFWKITNSILTDSQAKVLLALIGIGLVYLESLLAGLFLSGKFMLLPAIDVHFYSFSITFLILSFCFSLRK